MALTIAFLRPPQTVTDRDGQIIGIDALVEVFRDGVRLDVDPHHVCINPPLLVPTGAYTTETNASGQTVQVPVFAEDAPAAYVAWLVESVQADLARRGLS